MNGKLVGDYVEYNRLSLEANRACDPEYAVLRALVPELANTEDQQYWLMMLYLAYGEVLAGVEAFRRCPDWWKVTDAWKDAWKLPTAIERRGLRGADAMQNHLLSIVSQARVCGGVANWLLRARSWSDLERALGLVWGNGDWATYTSAEALVCVLDFPVQADSIGPVAPKGAWLGMDHLFGRRSVADAQWLYDEVQERGTRTRWEEMETSLCNFHKLVNGHYYVGHVIDKQQEFVRAFFNKGMDKTAALVLDARCRALSDTWLGERNDWDGVDRARERVYAETGKIVVRGATK